MRPRDEQTLFIRLAVCQAGRATLRALVDKSLASAGSDGRFQLHALARHDAGRFAAPTVPHSSIAKTIHASVMPLPVVLEPRRNAGRLAWLLPGRNRPAGHGVSDRGSSP